MKFRNDLTAQRVRELLDYDAETGELRWRVDIRSGGGRTNVRAGDVAGCPRRRGYWCLNINKRQYFAHRIAWLHYYGRWPIGMIDHKDQNTANNRISNLREASDSQNQINKQTRNSLGVPGLRQRRGKYALEMRIRGTLKHLGSFASLEEAAEARQRLARELHGEFAA